MSDTRQKSESAKAATRTVTVEELQNELRAQGVPAIEDVA